MKRLMTAACALLLTAGIVSAQTNVVSQNVVGYVTRTITNQLTMVGLNFGDVGTMAGIPIVALVPKDGDNLTAGTAAGNSDNIQVFTGAGYTTYFLCNGNIGKLGAYVPEADGWLKVGAAPVVTTDTMPNGGSFWFIARGATPSTPVTVTMAGQVASDATQTKMLQVGLSMIANGYSSELAFANPDAGLTIGTRGTAAGNSDNIQVHTGLGYSTYFLCNGNIGKLGAYVPEADGWLKVGAAPVVTTDTVPAGAAAWYINRGASALGWTNNIPYDLD